jgi:magnesium transporter
MVKYRHHTALAKDVATPVDTVVNVNDTIKQALSTLRDKPINHKIIYFYVVDNGNRLMGIVPTRKLLLSDPNVKIADIMETAVVCLSSDQTLQGAMELFTRYGLLAFPVTDNEGKFLGIIDVEVYLEESFDIADAKHRLDIFQIIGLKLEDEKNMSVMRGYRLRMPWILCNMMGGFVCAIISRLNSAVLTKMIMLAMFIPLVLTLSESISMQAMTHSIQFLRRPRTSFISVMKKVFCESRIVILMAISSGLIVGVISLLWGDGTLASTTIGVGIMISVFISSSFGIILPMALHYSRLDPKVASGPVVLMLADVLTTAIYLSLATWLLL